MTERDHEHVARRRARVEVHGHRGARGLRPENTLPGFAHALDLGVDAVELDVGLTADGVVVVNHDQVLSAVTCRDTIPAWPDDPAFPYVGRPIRELTLAQVRTVEAGVRRADTDDDEFVLTQLPVRGTGVPTLAEVCALVGGQDDTGPALSVEIKTDPGWPDDEVESFVAAVTDVLRSYGLIERSRILAFDWRVLPAARRHAPQAGRVALAEHVTLTPAEHVPPAPAEHVPPAPDGDWLAGWRERYARAGLAAAAGDAGATVLSPHHALVTAELIRAAWAAGLPVTVWTVNKPAEMERLIDLGVDAIVTDYPDRLRTVMSDRGLPVPRAAWRQPVRT